MLVEVLQKVAEIALLGTSWQICRVHCTQAILGYTVA
jgi:hypothetical protein